VASSEQTEANASTIAVLREQLEWSNPAQLQGTGCQWPAARCSAVAIRICDSATAYRVRLRINGFAVASQMMRYQFVLIQINARRGGALYMMRRSHRSNAG
jgi:hypothetical protein